MKKKKKRIRTLLALLNPKNLAREVHVYGYNFSWKSHVLIMFCSLIGISAIGLLFRLKPVYLSIALAAVVFLLPVFILASYRRMYEQKRFADVTAYMEQMLYSFQKDGKVLTALSETQSVFGDGQMRDVTGRASEYLNRGQAQTQRGLLRESLDIIEECYPCTKIRMVHELLVSIEEFGGDAKRSITLLLSDLEGWKRRGYKLQAQKKVAHTDNVVSIVVATMLCAVALYVLDAMRGMYAQTSAAAYSIFDMPVIQVTSLLFILLMIFVLVKSTRTLASDWLQPERMHDDAYLLDSYEAVVHFDEAMQKKKSLIFAAPFFVAAIPCLIFSKVWIGILLLMVGAFMLTQHKMGYHLAKKDMDKELYIELPQWLTSIALLLQTNNVQVSIVKSQDGAPVILRREIACLVRRLEEAPDSLKSYTDFCRQFDIPEAQSCMRMLHSISEAGTGDSGVQMNNLLKRVNEMQEQADAVRDENTAFRAKLIFSYPVLGATVKLLIDLTLGMFFMMGMIGSMGGV